MIERRKGPSRGQAVTRARRASWVPHGAISHRPVGAAGGVILAIFPLQGARKGGYRAIQMVGQAGHLGNVGYARLFQLQFIRYGR